MFKCVIFSGSGDQGHANHDNHGVHGERLPRHLPPRQRRQVPGDAAGGDDARDRVRDAVPLRDELRPPRPRRQERPRQLAARLQDCRLRAQQVSSVSALLVAGVSILF